MRDRADRFSLSQQALGAAMPAASVLEHHAPGIDLSRRLIGERR
jgi:hypothetical protein